MNNIFCRCTDADMSTGKGRPRGGSSIKKIIGPTPSRRSYHCNVCDAVIVGCDVGNHYRR